MLFRIVQQPLANPGERQNRQGKTMKIGGWMRLGIVISVLWLTCVLLATCYEVFIGAPFGQFMFVRFINDGEAVDGYVPVRQELAWARVALISLIPVVLFWFAAFVASRAYCWVKAGFKS